MKRKINAAYTKTEAAKKLAVDLFNFLEDYDAYDMIDYMYDNCLNEEEVIARTTHDILVGYVDRYIKYLDEYEDEDNWEEAQSLQDRLKSFKTLIAASKKNVKRFTVTASVSEQYHMTITVSSGLNADGFEVKITDADGNIVFENSYSYGYNASYSKQWADSEKPYVSDIIYDLADQYHISRDRIEVVPGRFVFMIKNEYKQKPIGEKRVKEFIEDYL